VTVYGRRAETVNPFVTSRKPSRAKQHRLDLIRQMQQWSLPISLNENLHCVFALKNNCKLFLRQHCSLYLPRKFLLPKLFVFTVIPFCCRWYNLVLKSHEPYNHPLLLLFILASLPKNLDTIRYTPTIRVKILNLWSNEV